MLRLRKEAVASPCPEQSQAIHYAGQGGAPLPPRDIPGMTIPAGIPGAQGRCRISDFDSRRVGWIAVAV